MARNLYWNPAGAANFNGATSWALTPTGTPNEAAPTAVDTCYFTNSNSQACNINAGSTCLDIDATSGTGYVGTIQSSGALSVAGNLKWSTGMTNTYTGTITFTATSTGKTITHNGKGSASSYTFNGVGGGWTFQDDPVAATTKNYTVTNGAVDFNGKTISISAFASNNTNTRTITFGAANMTCAAGWSINSATGLTFSGASLTLTISGASQTVTTPNLTIGAITFSGATGTLAGNNTITTLTASNTPLAITGSNTITTLVKSGLAQTFTITDGTTQTITTVPSGTAGNVITWTGSSTAGWTMSTPSITKLSYTNMSYSTKSGGVGILDKTCSSTSMGNVSWIQEYLLAPSLYGYKAGLTTYALDTASGTQNIAHGLGKIPKKVRIRAKHIVNASTVNYLTDSYGYYDGTTNLCIYTGHRDDGNSSTFSTSSAFAIKVYGGTDVSAKYQTGVITTDATNIIITWTKTSTPTGTAVLEWEVE